MWISKTLALLFGTVAGLLTSTGVIALITSVGIVPRLAGKTHTAKHVKMYETCITSGAAIGNVFFLTGWNLKLGYVFGSIVVGITGLSTGIFVGCLATSLAESLNATSVFARRTKLTKSLGIIIFTLALGKMLASIMQFYLGWAEIG